VAFDETVFPFSTLHPNAGAHLSAEISLLPNTLTNSIKDDNIFDPSVFSAPANDVLEVSDAVQESSPENLEHRDSIPGENGHHFMLPGVLSQIGHDAGHEADSPTSTAPASASDQEPDPVSAAIAFVGRSALATWRVTNQSAGCRASVSHASAVHGRGRRGWAALVVFCVRQILLHRSVVRILCAA
jgi:hypothetical protein